MHHRILEHILKNAWREKHGPTPAGCNHLEAVRCVRSHIWWEAIKDIRVAKRGHADCKHATKGPHTEWEDVIVLVYGLEWRSLRDNCGTLHEWLSNRSHFINKVCELWKLPLLVETVIETIPTTITKKTRRTGLLEDVPEQSFPGAAIDWGNAAKNFVFIVDCQPVQRVLCGGSPSRAPELRPSFNNITENLTAIIEAGWSPSPLLLSPQPSLCRGPLSSSFCDRRRVVSVKEHGRRHFLVGVPGRACLSLFFIGCWLLCGGWTEGPGPKVLTRRS